MTDMIYILYNPHSGNGAGKEKAEALGASYGKDAVLTDVEEAMAAMGEVTGATVREDITARIFERFCVGK